MSRQASRLPAWPFVALVLGVALLSLVAPAGWRATRVDSRAERIASPPRNADRATARRNVQLQTEAEGERSPAHGHPSLADQPTEFVTAVVEPEERPIPEYIPRTPAARPQPAPEPPAEPPAKSLEESLAPVEEQPAARSEDQPSAEVEERPTLELSSPSRPLSPRTAVRPLDTNRARASLQDESAATGASELAPVVSVPANAGAVVGEVSDEITPLPMVSDVASNAWPIPQTLLEQLNGLTGAGIASDWARLVLEDLARLKDLPEVASPAVKPILARLQAAVDAAPEVADKLTAPTDRAPLMRCAYSVSRRVAVWTALHSLAEHEQRERGWTPDSMAQLAQAYRGVEAYLARMQHSEPWRQYLSLQNAVKLNVEGSPTGAQRDIARLMLTRLDTACLSDEQSQFLQHPVFAAWAVALRRYAAEPIDPHELLEAIERYEATFSADPAQRLAHGYQALRWSTDAVESQLSRPLNDHYRNANVRVAISASLINRVLPSEHSTEEPVNDIVRDAHVSGTSQTNSRVRVFLVPDRLQWRLGLEAKGDVAAQTESRKGPATFFQDAWSNYNARKHVTVDKRGVKTERAEARARSSSDLRGFETDFDGIPIFNLMARAIASRQYSVESRAATAEVEEKVASVASQRLDEEIEKRLSDAEGEFQKRWLSPLRRMGLDPTPIDFETTDQRLIVRYRLAGVHQLAAHTPRPQAPSNSWMSIQLHESAINNTFDQLGLGGRKVPIEELFQELAAKFDRPAPTLPEDMPEGVTLTLAPQEGIRVRCDGGQVTLTLRVTELAQGKSKWKNFEVKATYVPSTDQREANLVRDGIIELGGERRGLGNQVALRAIFAKVLSKNRPIRLVNHSMAKLPQLSDLEVNQFVIHDGWIGMAMAPKLNTARIPYRQPRRFH